MATRTQIQYNSIVKEIEKLQKSLARYENILAKKTAKCEALGCNWTDAEWFEIRDAKTYTADQDLAHFEMIVARGDVDDTKHRLANAQSRLAKVSGKVEAESVQKAEDERLDTMEERCWSIINTKSAEERRAEYDAWFKEFKAECAKDGVTILTASNAEISGRTPKGKGFALWINNGFTERSWHCYSLNIDGEGIFTSGEFRTGYRYIKNS